MTKSQLALESVNENGSAPPREFAFLSTYARSHPSELQSFIQFVSHDLQVPLRFMNRIARRLLELHETELPGEVVDGIVAILSGTGEMSTLLENMLILSRLGNDHLERRQVDIEELMRQVLDDLEMQIGDRDVAVSIDKLPPCVGDQVLLKQLVFNLLSNAVKFTRDRPKATIRVGYRLEESDVVYFVEDNGVGFEPDKAEKIFQAFERLKNAKDFEGSGVGMALVKRIVEYHQGRVWAEGRPNDGATFFFVVGKS